MVRSSLSHATADSGHGRPSSEVADFAQPRGNAACRMRDCARHDAVRCSYVDAQKRRCATAWCDTHWESVGGIVYCRRHASTIIAVGAEKHDPLTLPDLDNRGPSLVNWVYRDLDIAARGLLDDGHRENEIMVRDSAVTVVVDTDRKQRWERSWKLLDSEGAVRRRISVVVGDSDNALVEIRINGEVVAKGVPPWIERRRRGVDVDADIDATQRRVFYSFMLDHMAAGLLPEAKIQAS